MDFNSLLETAKKMGETASNQQKELENKSFSFSCQNNLITGKINGKYQITELHISQDLMDDKDMLEDLMMIAINQGISQVERRKYEIPHWWIRFIFFYVIWNIQRVLKS